MFNPQSADIVINTTCQLYEMCHSVINMLYVNHQTCAYGSN